MKLKSALGTKNVSVKPIRILPGKSVEPRVDVGEFAEGRELHGEDLADAGQAEDDGDEEDHGAPLIEELLEAAPLDGRRIRAVAALAGLQAAEIVARTGVTLREVERILAADGSLPPRPAPRRTARCNACASGSRTSRRRLPTSTTSKPRPRPCWPACATCTSTTSSSAAGCCCSATTTRRRSASRPSALAPRELCVVDVDQRQLAFLAGAADTWFADLRVGLPAPLRGRFDIVLTDPPYSPAGVGLFAARGTGGDET